MSDSDENEMRRLHEDVRRRKGAAPEPKKIAEVISGLMARRGYAQVLAASQFESAWREAAGEKLAGHSRPGNVKAGVLEVIVRNTAALQELTFQKRQLLRKLAQLAPDYKVKDLRFRVGSLD